MWNRLNCFCKQGSSIDHDCKCERANFIENSIEIWWTFFFAKTTQAIYWHSNPLWEYYGSIQALWRGGSQVLHGLQSSPIKSTFLLVLAKSVFTRLTICIWMAIIQQMEPISFKLILQEFLKNKEFCQKSVKIIKNVKFAIWKKEPWLNRDR